MEEAGSRPRGQAPEKFGGLSFYDPDDEVMYTVHTGNMKWEIYHGYVALGVKEGDEDDDEADPFWLELLCDMIKDTDKQPEGVEIVKECPNE